MIDGIGNIQPLRGVTSKITFNEFNSSSQKHKDSRLLSGKNSFWLSTVANMFVCFVWDN